MKNKKSYWNVRDYVQCNQDSSRTVERGYDCINRMVLLLEGISFQELFGLTVGKLIPKITKKFDRAVSENLLEKAEELKQQASELVSKAGSYTFTDFYTTAETDLPPGVVKILKRFSRSGVFIPIPPKDAETSAVRKNSIERLVAAAPDKTYKDIFMTARKDASGAFIDAVQQARKSGIITLKANNLCCDNAYPVSHCFPVIDKFCNMPSEGNCSVGSDVC